MGHRRGRRDRQIYHITHIRNLPGILDLGELTCDGRANDEELLAQDIGMPTIKARRRRTAVTCEPGGTPSDYVPFYFGPRSPMLYSIWRGNVPTYAGGQDPVIYLVSTLGAVRTAGLDAVFTEGNAGAAYVDFHEDDPDLLEATIDWTLMRERMWRDTPDDPFRADRRQAEYLVHGSFPVDLLEEIAVRTRRRAIRVREHLEAHGIELPVTVRPEWYY